MADAAGEGVVERARLAFCSALITQVPMDTPLGKIEVYKFREAMRAAIAAMRVPTEAQIETGVDLALHASLGGDYRWHHYIRDLWQAMIDSALSPSPRQQGREEGECHT